MGCWERVHDQANSQWTRSVYNEWYVSCCVSCCVSLQQDDSDGGSDNEGQDGEASGTHSKGHHVHNMSCHTHKQTHENGCKKTWSTGACV